MFHVTIYSEQSPVGKDVGKELSETQQKIVHILQKNPATTVPQLAEIIVSTSRTIERNIAILKEKGLLVREGSKKHGYWKIVRENLSTMKIIYE